MLLQRATKSGFQSKEEHFLVKLEKTLRNAAKTQAMLGGGLC